MGPLLLIHKKWVPQCLLYIIWHQFKTVGPIEIDTLHYNEFAFGKVVQLQSINSGLESFCGLFPYFPTMDFFCITSKLGKWLVWPKWNQSLIISFFPLIWNLCDIIIIGIVVHCQDIFFKEKSIKYNYPVFQENLQPTFFRLLNFILDELI